MEHWSSWIFRANCTNNNKWLRIKLNFKKSMYTLNFFTDEFFLQCNEILFNVLFLWFFCRNFGCDYRTRQVFRRTSQVSALNWQQTFHVYRIQQNFMCQTLCATLYCVCAFKTFCVPLSVTVNSNSLLI